MAATVPATLRLWLNLSLGFECVPFFLWAMLQCERALRHPIRMLEERHKVKRSSAWQVVEGGRRNARSSAQKGAGEEGRGLPWRPSVRALRSCILGFRGTMLCYKMATASAVR